MKYILISFSLLFLISCNDTSNNFNTDGVITTNINSDVRKLKYDTKKVDKDGYIDVKFLKNDVSILLNIAVKDKSKAVGITEIKDPNDRIIYSVEVNFETEEIGDTISDFVDSAYFSVGDTAVLLPPTPRLQMKVGTYRFKVVRQDDEPFNKVEVFIKSVKSNERIDRLSYKINMNVWVAHPNIAIDGQDDIINYDEFKQLFTTTYKDSINRILSPHSLELDKINFYLANPSATEKFGNLDEEQMGDACREMRKVMTDDFALNLGFVRSLGGGAGVSPSPGNIMDKTASNGCFYVAESAYTIESEGTEERAQQMMAGNILHESAHFLSLEHPTEQEGTNFDQFDDTPECDIATNDGRDNAEDLNGIIYGTKDGNIDDFECGIAGGANNFLFYSGVHYYLPFVMSADQATAFRRHPLTIRKN